MPSNGSVSEPLECDVFSMVGLVFGERCTMEDLWREAEGERGEKFEDIMGSVG